MLKRKLRLRRLLLFTFVCAVDFFLYSFHYIFFRSVFTHRTHSFASITIYHWCRVEKFLLTEIYFAYYHLFISWFSLSVRIAFVSAFVSSILFLSFHSCVLSRFQCYTFYADNCYNFVADETFSRFVRQNVRLCRDMCVFYLWAFWLSNHLARWLSKHHTPT